MSHYVHQVPGRLRIKLPCIQSNARRAERVEKLLLGIEGVDTCSSNTLTTSVVVNYDYDMLNASKILEALERKGYYDPSNVLTEEEYIEGKMRKTGRIVGKVIIGHLVEKALENSALSLIAAFI